MRGLKVEFQKSTSIAGESEDGLAQYQQPSMVNKSNQFIAQAHRTSNLAKYKYSDLVGFINTLG